MPALDTARQPEAEPGWYAGVAGRAVIESEIQSLFEVLEARPGLPWLGFSAVARPVALQQPHGLWLMPGAAGWAGDIRCDASALPLASESVGTVIVQHVGAPSTAVAWLSECARVLVPGGRLWLFSLNPLSPYRLRWLAEPDADGHEPMRWRAALRRAGLEADAVAQGVGPRWQPRIDGRRRIGAGARAAYVICAEKRRIALTPKRSGSMVPALGDAA